MLKSQRFDLAKAQEYKDLNKRIKREMRVAKTQWMEDQCDELEGQMKLNNSKKAYQTVKDLTVQQQCKASSIQRKSGKCLTEEKDVLNRWTEYCSDLYNHQADKDNNILCRDNLENMDNNPPPILLSEVIWAVEALKKGKSAGVDNIPGELIQAGEDEMIDFFLKICNHVWKTGVWPKAGRNL